MSIEDRLARLERENRRLKLGGLLGLLVVASVFLMGQARPATTTAADTFTLLRPGGGISAIFQTVNGLPLLSLFGGATDGNDRANVAVVDRDIASVWVRGNGNRGSASIEASHDGKPAIYLQDTSGRTRLLMTLSGSTQEPLILMMDQAGSVIWSAP
jgi:hypothetical protein